MVGILPAKPDPALYEAQKKVTDQKAQAIEDLKKTTTMVEDASTKVTEKSGVPEDILQRFKTVQEKVLKLNGASPKMAPDAIEKERQAIVDSMSDVLKGYTSHMNAKQIQAAQDLYNKAAARVKSGESDTPDVKQQYKDLLDKAKENLDSVNAAANSTTEGFEDSSAKLLRDNAIFGYNPIGSNTDTIAIELQNADSLSRYSNRQSGLSTVALTFIYLFLIISILLGAIVSTNHFIGYNYWPVRMYYFVYGAVFFPFSLLYGLIAAPEWTASFLPILEYKKDTDEEPNFMTRLKGLIGFTLLPKVEDRTEDDTKSIQIWRTVLRVLCGLSTCVLGYGVYFMKVNVLDTNA